MTELAIIGGALAFSGFLLWALIKASEGKAIAQERAEQAKDALDAVAAKTKADAVVDRLSDDARRRELSKWARD